MSSTLSSTTLTSSSHKPKTRVCQVSNVSPSASREQLYTLMSYLGRIEEIKVFPSETNPQYASMMQKLCYVKYAEGESVSTAQHLTNTVFIDRALIVVPVPGSYIPDEDTALKTGGPSRPGQRQLPPTVVNQIQNVGDHQQVVTIDPTLSALGLPNYPNLPANTDANKIEEIRRTIYVGNLPKDVEPDEIMAYFNDNIGEVMYIRMAGNPDSVVRYCFVEFSNQSSVPTALQNNGIEFNGCKLRIQHSRVAIVKPMAKTADMAKKEVEEAMKKQKDGGGGVPDSATALGLGSLTRSDINRTFAHSDIPKYRFGRSRSRTPPWKRRGSRSPASRFRDRRSRSRDRFRSGRGRRSRSRSRDRRDRKKRSRSKSRDRSSRRDRDRDRSRDRKDREKDKDRSRSDRDRKKDEKSSSSSSSRKKESDRDRDRKDRERREKEKEREREKKKEAPKPPPMAGRDEEEDEETTSEPAQKVPKVEPPEEMPIKTEPPDQIAAPPDMPALPPDFKVDAEELRPSTEDVPSPEPPKEKKATPELDEMRERILERMEKERKEKEKEKEKTKLKEKEKEKEKDRGRGREREKESSSRKKSSRRDRSDSESRSRKRSGKKDKKESRKKSSKKRERDRKRKKRSKSSSPSSDSSSSSDSD